MNSMQLEQMRTLANMTLGSFLKERAETFADRPCLSYLPDGRSFTYAEVESNANRLANGLQEIGIDRDTHVAILCDNLPEQIFLYFALAKLGAVCTPVNTAAKGFFLEYFLAHSDSTVLISEAELIPNFQEILSSVPNLKTVIVLSDQDNAETERVAERLGEDFAVYNYSEVAHGEDSHINCSQPDDLTQIIYTSGTTGPSKGIMYTHPAILHWGMQVSRIKKLVPDDVYLVVFPLFHAGAWFSATMPTLWAGGHVVIGRKFSASQFFSQARACDATCGFMVSLASFLAAQPPADSDRDHQLRFLVTAPMPPDPVGFEERFNLKLLSGFGLSDYGMSHYRGPDEPPDKILSSGKLVPGWEAICADEGDLPVPPGETGEILLRCNIPGAAPTGYYKMPDESLKSRRNLWFHTGDLGYIDNDGYLFFVDRKKDSIRRRGENISSIELEAVLGRHPEVEASAFFAVKCDEPEDAVAVAVKLRTGATADAANLIAFCSKNMPRYAIPRFVRFVDTYPQTASGKIKKLEVRSETEAMIDVIYDREKESARC